MKIAGIVATIALAAVVAFGAFGTGAWFTDAATISDVQVQSGNLELEVTWYADPVATLEPGGAFVPVGWLHIKNAGDYDMKYRGYVEVTGGTELAPYVELKGVVNPAGHQGSYGYPNDVYVTPNDHPIEWEASLQGLRNWGSASNPCFYVASDAPDSPAEFEPADDTWVRVFATLAGGAPNSVQDKTLAATVHFEATQWINSGWTE